MIDLYVGTPGSGKSLHCAEVMYKALRHRKGIIANFDINLTVFKGKKIGRFTWVDNSELTSDLLLQYAFKYHRRNTNGNFVEGQTIVVIDECQILFNARSWNMKDRMAWCTFFTQHRKFGYDIILITQFDRLIDRQIRSLVEYQIIHRKVSNFKTFGGLLGILAGGSLFIAVREWYGLHEKIDSHWFRLNKRYMRLYDSYKIFDASGQAAAAESVGARGPHAEDAAAGPEASSRL